MLKSEKEKLGLPVSINQDNFLQAYTRPNSQVILNSFKFDN